MRPRGRSIQEASRQPELKRGALAAALIYWPLCILTWLPLLFLALVLAGCGTTRTDAPPPHVETVKVGVAVRASCVPRELGPPPAYVDTDEALRAAAGPGEALLLLGAGRKQRIARAGETEPVIEKCR